MRTLSQQELTAVSGAGLLSLLCCKKKPVCVKPPKPKCQPHPKTCPTTPEEPTDPVDPAPAG